MDMYILGSVHMAVMFVTKLSSKWDIRRHINVYILGNVHIDVKCVIKHTEMQVV
jgi:hypothetical protein